MAIHSNTRLRIPHRVVVATAAGLLVAFSTGTALLTRGQSIARINTVFEGNSQGTPQSRRVTATWRSHTWRCSRGSPRRPCG